MTSVPVAKAKRQFPSWQSQLAKVEQDCEKVAKFEASLKSRLEKSLKIEYWLASVENDIPNPWNTNRKYNVVVHRRDYQGYH